MKQDELTIIIPTLANELSSKALWFCLESLQKTFNGDVVVIVNGTGLSIETERKIKNYGAIPKTVEKQGQCGATNKAVSDLYGRWAKPWIMIANDDMVFSPGWFKKFTDVVENFGLLVASPNLVEPQKGAPPFIEKFCGGVGTVGTEPNFDKQCFLDFVESYKENENRMEYMMEDGFNLPLLIRKDVWDEIGGYDEEYDPWSSCSDTDLQAKIMYAGITPKRIRNTLVYHFSGTSGTFHPSHEANKHENWRYFENKWGFPSWTNDQGVWYKPEFPKEFTFEAKWKDKYASKN